MGQVWMELSDNRVTAALKFITKLLATLTCSFVFATSVDPRFTLNETIGRNGQSIPVYSTQMGGQDNLGKLQPFSLTAAGLLKVDTSGTSIAGTVTCNAGTGTFAVDASGHTVPVSGTFWPATQPVSGTFFQATQPVSVASLPLPSGAATSALQTTGNTSLSSLVSGQTTGNNSLASILAAQATASAQASALSELVLMFNAATTSNGHLSNAVTELVSIDSKVTGVSTSALQTAGNASLGSIDTKFPALGQAGAGASIPVVIPTSQFNSLATVAAQATQISYLASVDAKLSSTGSALLVTDTALTGILNSQNTTTSGQLGPLDQGATTTSAPVYVTGRTNPLSLTTAGALRVDNSGVTQPVSGTFWQATQPVSGTFWQATQPVSGTFFQATQPVSIASMPSTPVTGTFWQATQPVSGTFYQTTQPVSIASMPSTPVTGTFFQATQPVSIASMPSTSVTGTFFQATQPISYANQDLAQASTTSGQVGPLIQGATTTGAPTYTTAKTNPLSLTTAGALRVDNSAVTQPVSGTFWQATQPVSGTFYQATQPVSIASMPTTAVTGTFWQATQPVSIASLPSTAVTNAGTFAVQAAESDGANVTLGAKADAKSSATDNTAITIMQVLKQISASVQSPPSEAVTGTFWQATQPVSGTFWQATQPVSIASLPSVAVTNAGTFAVQAAESDGANVTLGAKADAKNSATDTTSMSIMSVLKQISASVQAPPSQAVTGTFFQATQPVSIAGSNPCNYAGATLLSITGATSGTSAVQIIALSGSTKIYICSMSIIGVSGTTPTFSLVQGTGSNCVTGQSVLQQAWTTAAGTIYAFANPVAVSVAGNAVCYKGTGTTPIQNYTMTYVQQ